VKTVNLFDCLDYRFYLKRLLEEKSGEIPGYSLRKFSMQLGINPGRLSLILRGKEGLSKVSAEKIAAALSLSKLEKEYFIQLVLSADSRSKKTRQKAKKLIQKKYKQRDYSEIELDTFSLISDWYHFAILELVNVKGFENSSQWVAKKLSITQAQASLAVERLCRMGMLNWQNGKLTAAEPTTATPTDVPSQAIRKYQTELIKKSLIAIETQNVHERDITSTMISIKKESLVEAKQLIKEFRRNFARMIEKQDKADAVYSLNVQFINLTSSS